MDVPEPTPVTTPVLLTIVATLVVPLVHVPPVMPSANVIVDPEHRGTEPDMIKGKASTVIIVVALQPVLRA